MFNCNILVFIYIKMQCPRQKRPRSACALPKIIANAQKHDAVNHWHGIRQEGMKECDGEMMVVRYVQLPVRPCSLPLKVLLYCLLKIAAPGKKKDKEAGIAATYFNLNPLCLSPRTGR